jgi:hypothetical protein
VSQGVIEEEIFDCTVGLFGEGIANNRKLALAMRSVPELREAEFSFGRTDRLVQEGA